MKIVKVTEIKKNGNMAVKSIKTHIKIKVKTQIYRVFNVISVSKMDTMQINVQIQRNLVHKKL